MKNLTFSKILTVLALLAVFGLVGCGGGGGGSANNPPPVNAGPGVVVSQPVDAAVGGTITVHAPGNALNGTTVTFPAGALGTSGTDTISVGYSDTLPGPINPDALAAGATVITKAVELTHTSTSPFSAVVEVTIPYDTTLVGQSDVPVVVYWDTTLNKYEAVNVKSFDPVAGTVTFTTKHFTKFLALATPNVKKQISVTIGFDPKTNGFSVRNFSTQKGPTDDGACYGLTSFAAWFFQARKSPLFTEYFGNTSPFISSKNPIEQDVARELIYQTYLDTNFNNRISLAVGRATSWSPIMTAGSIINQLAITGSPQLITLEATYPTATGAIGAHYGWHSVLVYGWDAVKGNFLIYDPNDPGNSNNVIHFDATTDKFNIYTPIYTSEYEFTSFNFDSFSDHYDPKELETLLSNAINGWPSKAFNTITNIQSSLTPQPSQLPANTFAVDPSGTSTISGTVNVAKLDFSKYKTMAYFYVDGKNVSIPYVDVDNGNFTSSNQLTKDIQWGPAKTSAELIIIIAYAGGVNLTTNQIEYGYAGFFRGTLVIPTAPTGSTPSAPTGASATAGNGQATISWNTVSGATSYNIYWSTTSGVTKTNGTKISNATSPYTHTGRTNGTTYYYVVTAVNSYGESMESSQASATTNGTGGVSYTW